MTINPINHEDSQFRNDDTFLEEEQEPQFTIVETDPSLHSYYKESWLSSAKQPDANTSLNLLQMEYQFVPINRLDIIEDESMEEVLEQVSMETPGFALSRTVWDMKGLFHVNRRTFCSRWDRKSEINENLMEYAYQFSALRSFAWTLADYCAGHGLEPKEVDLEVLHRIVQFIAQRKWLNYKADSFCAGLCSGDDLYGCYLPDEILKGNRELAKRIFRTCVVFSNVSEQLNSLDELRRDLEYIYPAVRKLWEELGENRDYDQPLTGDQADVVYAWCVVANAAEKPFCLQEGPMDYEFSYTESRQEAEEMMYWKNAIGWMRAYGQYLNRNAAIQFSGKLFVFTGFGGKSEEKKHPLVEKVLEQGGVYRTAVSKLTDYLVVDPAQAGASKTNKALDLQDTGCPVQMILRFDLESALGMEHTGMDVSSLLERFGPEAINKTDAAGASMRDKSQQNNVVLPDGVQVVEKELFKNDQNLHTITLPKGVRIIENDAFSGCNHLTQVNLPSTLEEIRAGAFAFCDHLTKLVIPEGVTKIGRRAFFGCRKLKDLYFLGWDIDFDASVFEGLRHLRIHAPAGSDALIYAQDQDIECDNALPSGVQLEDLLNKRKNKALKEIEALPAAVVIPPSDYESEQPGRLDRYTGSDTAVMIPDGISVIGSNSFYNQNIVLVVIPEGVVTIESDTFRSCEKLQQVILPKSLKKIEDGAFSECSRLISIRLLEEMECIQKSAFDSCSNLTESILPSKLEKLGIAAFADCKRLSTLKIQEGIQEIPDSCFDGCNRLEEVQLPNSLKIIGERAFADCKRLPTLKIQEGVQEILDRCFDDCCSLEEVHLPNSLKIIGKYAFSGCEKLSSITIPEGVEELRESSFFYCINLGKVNLPNTLQSIGPEAFEYCEKLEQIVIPGSVIQIGKDAFRVCDQLKDVTILSKEIELGKNSLESGLDQDMVIHLKPGSQAEQYAKENQISYDYELSLDVE